MTEFNESGSKYLREMQGLVDGKADVYSVLLSFNVTCPARQHAIKKLLSAGQRQKASELQDVAEARDAIDRALQLLTSPPAVPQPMEHGPAPLAAEGKVPQQGVPGPPPPPPPYVSRYEEPMEDLPR